MYIEVDVSFTEYILFQASRFPYRHKTMDDASSQIDAMDGTRDIVAAAGFNGDQCFPYSQYYLTWETNKVYL